MTRDRALLATFAALAAAGTSAGCEKIDPNNVSIGAKNFTEELVLGEIYAQSLERAGLHVTRKFDLGGTQVAMAALRRGDIDLYPEYTGTALLSVLHNATIANADELYRHVKAAYAKRYDLVWLDHAPFDDPEALATTRAAARKFGVRTLRDVSREAPRMRLGTIPEFTTRADGLTGLRKRYGGFDFASVKLFDIGLKYTALESGQVDIVVAFGTDGQIAYDELVLIEDPDHFWPAYQVAPVVRRATLARVPRIATVLDAIAPRLTNAVMRDLNARVDREKQDPADAASAFLASASAT